MKWSTTLIVFLLAIFFFYYLKRNSVQLTQQSTELTSHAKDDLKIAAENAKINEGLSISKSDKLVKDGIEYKLKNILKKDRINLFLRISDSYCIDCIDSCINQTNAHLDASKISLFILGKFSSLRSLKFFEKRLKSKNIYVIDNLFLPAENSLQPYFFMVNNNLVTSNYFFPNKEKSSATSNYLKRLTQ